MSALDHFFSTTPRLISVLIVFVGAVILWLLARGAIDLFVKGLINQRVPKVAHQIVNQQRKVQRAKTIGSVLTSIASLIIGLGFIWFLVEALHLSLAPLLASISVAGVAIGFGTQQLIRDFIAGIFITVEDQFGIGDYIEVNGVEGRVINVGLRTTELVDDRGVVWYLRNGEMMQIGNRSQGDYIGEDTKESSSTDDE
ncbi:MAG: mechanosensitive ion channel family protein [Micrococcaceae bacterium]